MQLDCYIVNMRVLQGRSWIPWCARGISPPPLLAVGKMREALSLFWLKHQILKLWSLTVNVFPLLSVLDLFHLCQICKSAQGWLHRWRHVLLSSVFITFLLYFRLRALSSGGSVTSPPLSPALPKYKLADYRYGREEMLALFLKDNKVSRKRKKVWCVAS